MTPHYRAQRAIAAASLALAIAAGGLATASTAQAYDTDTTTISCSAVKVRKAPSKTSTVVGIGYRHDKVLYDQFAYKRAEKTWYTRGTVTRKSDGKKIRGYMSQELREPLPDQPRAEAVDPEVVQMAAAPERDLLPCRRQGSPRPGQ
ncbi:hypothetical protein [Streptomyces sp. NPDC091217]|uniref:hypothetical protein n=1 Tax=Streptomyces sp. NPDC091217 TaxID=3365975 RepID=UPI003815A2EF